MLFAKHKKAAIITGICMGILTPLGAMAISSDHANAAILVYDAENVAQAIKEVTNTMNILEENRKQVEIGTINIKSLDPDSLLGIIQQLMNAKDDFNWCKTPEMSDPDVILQSGKVPGILDGGWDEKPAKNITEELLRKCIGSVDDIFADLAHPFDPYKNIEMNLKAVNATAISATKTAQAVQMSDKKYADAVHLALDAANNAEGTKQVQQSIAVMTATNAMETRNGNEMLSQLVGLTAEDIYAKNVERAISEKRLQDSKDALHLTAFGSKE